MTLLVTALVFRTQGMCSCRFASMHPDIQTQCADVCGGGLPVPERESVVGATAMSGTVCASELLIFVCSNKSLTISFGFFGE